MTVADLPIINAGLNGLSAVFLTVGYVLIRTGRKQAHRNCMVSAFVTSTIFLVCYLIYHYSVPHTRFADPEWFRPIYLALLASHVVLAVVNLPLVLATLYRALRGQMDLHRKLARWTFPIWMYVSVTGVIIYLLLYQIYPQR